MPHASESLLELFGIGNRAARSPTSRLKPTSPSSRAIPKASSGHCIRRAANRRISTLIENLCAGGADIAFDVGDPWAQQKPRTIGCHFDKERIHRKQCIRHSRFDRGPCQDTVRPARANLMALPRDGKDADHKTGGPRYSLSLCRSAIVSSTEDRLRASGFARELEDLRGSKDQLKKILELARDKDILDGVTWKQADDIRQLGNDAVHGDRLPTEAQCKSAFDQTRGILQHLYD